MSGVHLVQEHVHLTQGPGAAVHLLAVKGEIVRADLLAGPDQQRSGAAGRIADTISLLRGHEPCQGFGNLRRGIKLAGLFTGAGRKSFNQVLVNITDNVHVAIVVRLEIQCRKIFQKILEAVVALAGLAQIGFAVEIDVAKYIVQFGLIGIFNLFEHRVDRLPDIAVDSMSIEIIKGCFLTDDKALASHGPFDSHLVSAILFLKLGQFVLSDIAEVFHEQHRQDVVLILDGSMTPRKVSQARQTILKISVFFCFLFILVSVFICFSELI